MLQSHAGVPSHLLLGGLLESLPEAMAEFDPELRCTRSNLAFAQLLALGMQVQSRIRSAVTAAAQGRPSRFDVVRRMGEDRRITVDMMLMPLRDDAGSITHLIASSVDISDRKAGEEALQLSEQRFRQVVESAPDGMAMVGMDSRMMLVNASMEALFGYRRRRDEMLGQRVEMLMPERYRSAHGALFSGFMRQPEARDMLDGELARARDRSERVAVLFLDLDGFKLINDTMGHARGDLLLGVIAEHISGLVCRCGN